MEAKCLKIFINSFMAGLFNIRQKHGSGQEDSIRPTKIQEDQEDPRRPRKSKNVKKIHKGQEVPRMPRKSMKAKKIQESQELPGWPFGLF